jgi:hypothetical protein
VADYSGMTRAIAYTRQLATDPADALRAIVVAVAALVLIAAGHALPF